MAYPDRRCHKRLICGGLALACLLASVLVPPLGVVRPAYDVLAVVDITTSMTVRDQKLDGETISRLDLAKVALHRLLIDLPCASRLGLAVFVERRPFLLFEPVETCGNYAALDAEITALDWRMGWDSESHIADGLIAAIRRASTLGADLIFLSDGQEEPPLRGSAPPDLIAVRFLVHGVVLGVGGRDFVSIPKYDKQGREVGTWHAGELASTSEAFFRGHEHLSAVDEPHLRLIAATSGLAYDHLDGPDDLFPTLVRTASRHVLPTTRDIAWMPASTALALLILGEILSSPIPHFAIPRQAFTLYSRPDRKARDRRADA